MASKLDISDEEFALPRTSFELIEWLGRKFTDMDIHGDLDEIYWERKGLNVKKLLEEALPISRFAMTLTTPFNIVWIKLNPGNENFDGEIELRYKQESPIAQNSKFKIEVSTTETEETTMRRQALSRQGVVPLTGKIARDGREIIADEYEFERTTDRESKVIGLMFNHFVSKVESKRYGRDTVLLIHSADFNPLSIRSRAKLVRRTRFYLIKHEPNIKDVYFSYSFTNTVDSVKFYE